MLVYVKSGWAKCTGDTAEMPQSERAREAGARKNIFSQMGPFCPWWYVCLVCLTMNSLLGLPKTFPNSWPVLCEKLIAVKLATESRT